MRDQQSSIFSRLSGFLSWPRSRNPAGAVGNTLQADPQVDVEQAAVHQPDITSEIREIKCSHSAFSGVFFNANDLPLELWFEIIQNALEPAFATQTMFLPKDIQSYFNAFVMHHYSNPATAFIKRTIGSLRLVSKSFRNAVDQIVHEMELNPSWIRHYSPDNMERYKPCIRFDVRLPGLAAPRIPKKYRYKASIVAIQTQLAGFDPQESEPEPFADKLLAYPQEVRVLRISCISPGGNKVHFPASLLSGFSSLTTLSLGSFGPLVFHGPFMAPSITTLFLTHLVYDYCTLSQWSFPNLENLSIDSRGWPRSNDDLELPNAFLDFLERHKDTIRSLRAYPLSATSQKDRLHRVLSEMPKLEALATDFVRFSYMLIPSGAEVLLDAILTRSDILGRLKHIIQVSSREYSVTLLTQSLLNVLEAAPHASTLTVTEDCFLVREKVVHGSYILDEKGLLELDRVCQSRGIQVYGDMSLPQCCVLRACEGLSSLGY
ncbi:hypothetical protein CPB86DRAFT_810149 [Serendipita vermifera]|nr:hypothetical protein CPB86DRAFT_810149 [Serendipita vermifera]